MDIIYPIYTEQNYLNLITLISIVKSLLHCNPPNIWINIIQITIQIKFLHGTTFVQTRYYIKIKMLDLIPLHFCQNWWCVRPCRGRRWCNLPVWSRAGLASALRCDRGCRCMRDTATCRSWCGGYSPAPASATHPHTSLHYHDSLSQSETEAKSNK